MPTPLASSDPPPLPIQASLLCLDPLSLTSFTSVLHFLAHLAWWPSTPFIFSFSLAWRPPTPFSTVSFPFAWKPSDDSLFSPPSLYLHMVSWFNTPPPPYDSALRWQLVKLDTRFQCVVYIIGLFWKLASIKKKVHVSLLIEVCGLKMFKYSKVGYEQASKG